MNWTEHDGYQSEMPLEVDTTSSPTTVYLRRNIEEVTETDEQGVAVTHWHYEEAELTTDEYEEYKLYKAVEQQRADIDYIAAMADIEL